MNSAREVEPVHELEPNQHSVVVNRLRYEAPGERSGEIQDPEALLYYQRALERELEEVRVRLRQMTGGTVAERV